MFFLDYLRKKQKKTKKSLKLPKKPKNCQQRQTGRIAAGFDSSCFSTIALYSKPRVTLGKNKPIYSCTYRLSIKKAQMVLKNKSSI